MPGTDYERMIKMAEFISKYTQTRKNSGGDSVSEKASQIEKKLCTPELLTIKSAIPYLEPGNRRLLSMVVKYIEIQRLLDYLRETAQALGKINEEAERGSPRWRKEMLELIKPHLSPNLQEQMDMLDFLSVMVGGFQEPSS